MTLTTESTRTWSSPDTDIYKLGTSHRFSFCVPFSFFVFTPTLRACFLTTLDDLAFSFLVFLMLFLVEALTQLRIKSLCLVAR